MDIIPNAVSPTVYSGGAEDFMRTPLQSLVEQVEAGTLRIYVGRVFHLDQIADAHRCMGGEFRWGKDRRTDLLTCTYFCRFFSLRLVQISHTKVCCSAG